jgi:hypothetical protein
MWERHLVAAVALSEGWLPRYDRGSKPLPQKTKFVTDKEALPAITR